MSMPAREGTPRLLNVLYERIEERTSEILARQPSWPCRKGCDTCCRRLARLPELTRAEWAHVWEGFRGLDAGTRQHIRARVRALAIEEAGGAHHFVCPFLASDTGACQVYAHRPAACRMYGFYVSRGEGRYCDQIHERVSRGELDGVVWGNQDAVERELAQALGPPISIVAWCEEAGDEAP